MFDRFLYVQHPLYSPWTLWFDSAQTKGKGTGTPATPMATTPGIPSTPLTAQAQNWMEDIKKVVSLDSVEEFWGYVFSRHQQRIALMMLIQPV